MSLDQWIILICGPTAVALSFVKTHSVAKWGPIIGLVSQAGWFYTLYQNAQWGAFLAGFAYTAAWLYAAWRLWEKEIKLWLSSKHLIDRTIAWFLSAASPTTSLPYPETSLPQHWTSNNVPKSYNSFSANVSSEGTTPSESPSHNG